jgi:hypothetical protein
MERAADGAARFETNAYLEKIIELRANDPQTFDSLSPSLKLSLGYYESARRRAKDFE